MPGLDAMAKTYDKLNFLMVLETDVANFELGAWIRDIGAGLKHLTKWNRVAIVTDQKGVEKFTDIFSFVVPGEFKGFSLTELDAAKSWVSGQLKEA